MKRKNFRATALLLLCLLGSYKMIAQPTGSYDTSITFMGAPRALSVYAPSTYTSTTAYRLMICLHGLGDTASNYRNALVGTFDWDTHMPNTIFVCPEAYTRNSDYYYPTGGEDVIQASIDYAMETYHIDTANIILQGFSLGGRAALRFGLDNYANFKGLLLNTPAVQGVKQAINNTAYTFTYSNARHLPIYITHGATDVLYTGPIDSAYEQLVLNDAKVRYYDIAGLAHSIPAFAEMSNVLSFMDTQYSAGLDLDVVMAKVTPRSCVTSIMGGCLIRNTGADTIHTATLMYTAGSSASTYTWTGVMPPFGHALISLPAFTAAVGNPTLSVSVSSLEAGVSDTFLANNQASAPFVVQTTGSSFPYFEGFETTAFPPMNWVAEPAGDIYAQWDLDNDVKRTGVGSMYAFNTILIFDNSERSDEISTPAVNLTTATAPHLTFDVAYNYHHYTPPYLLMDTVFADTLSVMISTDCGDHYTTLFKKGGADLATFFEPILNPLSLSADFINPADSNWHTVDLDLGAYTSSDKAIVKFSYKSALGGSINIDNVRFDEAGVSVKSIGQDGLRIYPNPASDMIVAEYAGTFNRLTITNSTGQTVFQQGCVKGTSHVTVPVNSLPSGIYLLQLIGDDGNVMLRKISVQH